MGSRLGVWVKTHQRWEIYYDHWAAQSIGLDIAIDGVEATLQRVRQMAPMSFSTPAQWKEAPWLEGSLFIDLTTCTVVWAEESEALYLPRLINAMIEHSWPGWSAVWAAEGTRGTLQAAGVDPQSIFTPHESHLELWDQTPDLYPWEAWHGNDPISVHLSSGQLVTWRAYGFLQDIAHVGPRRFHDLARDVLVRASTESAQWETTRDDEAPTTGVFVDYTAKHVRWWSLSDEDRHIPVFEHLWPDWSIICASDDYSWHERLIGEPLRSWENDVAECREWLTKAFVEGRRPNPIVSLAAKLADAGENFEVLPDTMRFIASERATSPSLFHHLLDHIGDSAPLPPARFIDQRGEISPPLPRRMPSEHSCAES